MLIRKYRVFAVVLALLPAGVYAETYEIRPTNRYAPPSHQIHIGVAPYYGTIEPKTEPDKTLDERLDERLNERIDQRIDERLKALEEGDEDY